MKTQGELLAEADHLGDSKIPINMNGKISYSLAIFELTLWGDEVRVIDERQYQLVQTDQLNADEIRIYRY